ncbi:putative dual-specificity phosphatase [Pseudomonas phage D6]|nr:putative dual-specificity phosphatase [Pseudomonas phage D6]
MIPKELADRWIKLQGYENAQAVNSGGCERFAQSFLPLFPKGDIIGTDNFVCWDHGSWPGGHVWIYSEGKHYDSEALEGVNSWRELPFFKRNLSTLKTVTWMSKDWITLEDRPGAIISIGDPGEDIPTFHNNPVDVLRIECHDIPDNVAIEDLDKTFVQFDWHDARKILEFEARYKDHDIIVHCHAGVSRSCAVALYLADKCGRLLDVSRPCTGNVTLANKWVQRQLSITHYDLMTTGKQVHPLPVR